MQKKITERFLRTLKSPDTGRVEYLDQVVKGLALRVSSKGVASWAVYYRVRGDRKKRRYTIGKYPSKSLATARSEAREALQMADRGEDPSENKKAIKIAPSVAELLGEFETVEAKNKESGAEMMRMLRKDVLPTWGSRKVNTIARRDAVLLLDKVRARAPVTANRLHGRLTRLFNFAVERGILESSPLHRLRKGDESPRERALTDDEIRVFWRGLDRLTLRKARLRKTRTKGSYDNGISRPTALALKLILATGQRPGEVVGMRWDEISGNVWVLPPERTKNHREHRVPLPDVAQEILAEAKELCGGSAYVFSGARTMGSRPMARASLSRAFLRNIESIGLDESATPHDLRRTMRTKLAELGVDDIVAERVLNHSLQGMAKVYNRHHYLPEKLEAMTAWNNRLLKILRNQAPASNVVPIRTTAGVPGQAGGH